MQLEDVPAERISNVQVASFLELVRLGRCETGVTFDAPPLERAMLRLHYCMGLLNDVILCLICYVHRGRIGLFE